jgi:RNA-directed DNA polymerase
MWKYDWVLEFDIKGLFDNIDHELFVASHSKTCDV